jgi:hypothetical protein
MTKLAHGFNRISPRIIIFADFCVSRRYQLCAARHAAAICVHLSRGERSNNSKFVEISLEAAKCFELTSTCRSFGLLAGRSPSPEEAVVQCIPKDKIKVSQPFSIDFVAQLTFTMFLVSSNGGIFVGN